MLKARTICRKNVYIHTNWNLTDSLYLMFQEEVYLVTISNYKL